MSNPILGDRLARYIEKISAEAATMEELCQRVADGEPLRAICKAWDVPYARVAAWVADDEKRASAYDAAKRFRADALADEALAISDEQALAVSKQGVEYDPDVQRDRLRVDTRLKLIAKWDKQRYGEGPQVAVSASVTLNLTAEDTHVL